MSHFNYFLVLMSFIWQLTSLNAQDTISKKDKLLKKKPILQQIDSLPLNDQFDLITQSSDSYNLHKVVKFEWLQKLKTHVNDSVTRLKTELTIQSEKVKELELNHTTLQSRIEDFEEKERKSFTILGIPINKVLYQLIMWSLVVLFGGMFVYFRHKFKQSHVLTREALKRYEDLEEEFRQARSRALEREQMLNRKLMDEMNKK